MKPILSLSLVGLLALQSVAFASTIQGLLVSEKFVGDDRTPQATTDRPVTYAVVDGGYVEGGRPIAGEKPPAPAAVALALQSSLAAQGYQPVSGDLQPAVLITYHWGVIRQDMHFRSHINPPSGRVRYSPEYPNLRARISLVSPANLTERAIDFLDNRFDVSTQSVRDTIDYARDPRYFVILSAYDFNDLTRKTATLLWRVKVSAADNAGAMSEVIPALVQGASQFWGKAEADPVGISVQIPPAAPANVESFPGSATDVSKQIDPSYLQSMVTHEHEVFSGDKLETR